MLVACQGHNTSSLPAAGNMHAARGDIAALLNTRARIASKAGLENEFLGSRSMVLQMRHGGGAYTNLLWADGHSGHCQGGDLPLANYTTGPFWTGKQK